ncbi:MAG: response regulator [Pseudomonadota bacterium]|nr:response regulator [Pseudomonadota bacterium]
MNQVARILLVEDDPRDAELALLALKDYRLANEIVLCHDGEEAMDYLCRRGQYSDRPAGNPLVVLLDLKLPKVDGLEVLHQIRADPQLRPLPVVILTSSREEQDLVRGYALGVNAFVVKPVRFDRFIEALKEISVFWLVINEPPPGCVSRGG